MKGGWLWSIQPKALNAGEVVQQPSLSTFGNNEHLQTLEELAAML
jgi:hypothetical protein